MPTIKAPKPFIDILRGFLREGKDPGEFIIACITGYPFTEIVSRADNWNAENLWHIGAIIREYVPMALRRGDTSLSKHQKIMELGWKGVQDGKQYLSTKRDKAYFNYMREWNIPDYVQEIEERQPLMSPPPTYLDVQNCPACREDLLCLIHDSF